MAKLQLLKVGADVEHFLVDVKGGLVPCIDVVGGTKEKPRPILGGNGFAIQEDNVALEYNIPAADNIHSFVYSITRIQEAILEEVKNYGLAPLIVPSAKFSPKQLQHPRAKTAGCEPDYCVWEKRINDPVKLDKEIRGAGAHVHISFKVGDAVPVFPDFLMELECVAMACDLFIGVPSMRLDMDTDRRKFYGKAGAFRHKRYGDDAGLEYRVCSNWWTTNPKYTGWVYEQVEKAFQHINHYGVKAHDNLKQYKDLIVKAINESDATAISSLMRAHGIKLP